MAAAVSQGHPAVMPAAIGVLVVDDHPAVRAGLRALIDGERDMHVVGEASDEYTLVPAIRRFEPDVVLLDYKLPGTDGISLCHRVKANASAPRIVIYSSFVMPSMAVPARIAGADALVDKAVEPRDLTRTIRRVAAGEATAPQITAEALALAGDLLPIDDLPILGMLVNGVPNRELAETLGISLEDVNHRIDRILGVLA